MPIILKRNCNRCKSYYEGRGKFFCSFVCSNKDKNKGRKHTQEFKERMRNRFVSEITRNKLRIANIGKKYPLSIRLKQSVFFRGSKNPAWKGGITSLRKNIRRSIQYRLWKDSVFKRDNWTCVHCKKRGCELHADHIKLFSEICNEFKINNIEEALKCKILWDINNGQTLCKLCHKKKTSLERKKNE